MHVCVIQASARGSRPSLSTGPHPSFKNVLLLPPPSYFYLLLHFNTCYFYLHSLEQSWKPFIANQVFGKIFDCSLLQIALFNKKRNLIYHDSKFCIFTVLKKCKLINHNSNLAFLQYIFKIKS